MKTDDKDDILKAVRSMAGLILREGVLHRETSIGRHFFIATSEHMGMAPGGFVVVMEGGGVFVWDGQGTLTTFRLLSSGFDIETSATLAKVLTALAKESKKQDQNP